VLDSVKEAHLAEAIDVEAYYKRYGPMVMRRCRRLLGDEELAKDAMQETFVNLIRKQAMLKHQAPSSLLYRMATNVCLNRIRTVKRHPEDPDSVLLARIASYGEPGEHSAARLLLDKLFGRHPASTREIAVLHLHDGLTLDQVAQATGLSVSGVRKRIRKLRASLSELEGEI
jgi:RNA polymerase sigma-70 factor, ECF subfamily